MTTYESRLPHQLHGQHPGEEVLLVQTTSGVPLGYGRDQAVEVIVGVFPSVDAALGHLRARYRAGQVRVQRDRQPFARRAGVVDLDILTARCTAAGWANDTYRLFNA